MTIPGHTLRHNPVGALVRAAAATLPS